MKEMTRLRRLIMQLVTIFSLILGLTMFARIPELRREGELSVRYDTEGNEIAFSEKSLHKVLDEALKAGQINCVQWVAAAPILSLWTDENWDPKIAIESAIATTCAVLFVFFGVNVLIWSAISDYKGSKAKAGVPKQQYEETREQLPFKWWSSGYIVLLGVVLYVDAYWRTGIKFTLIAIGLITAAELIRLLVKRAGEVGEDHRLKKAAKQKDAWDAYERRKALTEVKQKKPKPKVKVQPQPQQQPKQPDITPIRPI